MRFAALLSALCLLIAISSVSTSPVRAEEHDEVTVVVQANVQAPIVDLHALGTLVTTTDPDTGQGEWYFQGTLNGNYAESSGDGTISGSDCTATITMTSIDNWQMPGIPRPDVPAAATVRSNRGLAYVSLSTEAPPLSGKSVAAGLARDIPLAISDSFCFPLQSGNYTISTPGKGEDRVDELPVTGVGLTSSTDYGSGLFGGMSSFGVAGAALLFAVAVLMVVRFAVSRPGSTRRLRT